MVDQFCSVQRRSTIGAAMKVGTSPPPGPVDSDGEGRRSRCSTWSITAQAMSIADPKILVAVMCWVLYSFEVYARRAIGWSGRRAAWLSTIGFVIVLLNFVPVGYFLTRSHNF